MDTVAEHRAGLDTWSLNRSAKGKYFLTHLSVEDGQEVEIPVPVMVLDIFARAALNQQTPIVDRRQNVIPFLRRKA